MTLMRITRKEMMIRAHREYRCMKRGREPSVGGVGEMRQKMED